KNARLRGRSGCLRRGIQSEVVACVGGDVATLAIATVKAGTTTPGHILFISQVLGIDAELPVGVVVTDHGVVQGFRRHDRLAPATHVVADVTYAGTDLPVITDVHLVPQGHQALGHCRQANTRLVVNGVHVGIGNLCFELLPALFRFQLPAGNNGANLFDTARRRALRNAVLLFDVKVRGRHGKAAILGQVLDATFGLVTGGRVQRAAGAIATEVHAERFRITDVRRQAVVKAVHHTDTAGR